MLTFTHTYLLSLAYKKINQRNSPIDKGELILGNVVPDFVTHLGREQFQARAHSLAYLDNLSEFGSLEWGAIFHILCDNYSTLGRIVFDGDYHEIPKTGFIEQLSRQVQINFPLNIPKRRILQCAFDIFVIRDKKELLIKMLSSAESYLNNNFEDVIQRVAKIYNLNKENLRIGLNRYAKIYGQQFIKQAALEAYRLFPLARSLLKLHSLTDPRVILEGVKNHPELMELVQKNMFLIENNWQDLLDETVQQVFEYPGVRDALH